MPSPSSPNAIQGRLPQPSPVRPTSHESLCQRWPPYLPAIGRLVAGFRRAKCHHLVRCSTLVSSPNVTMEQKLFSFLNPLQWIEASVVISKHKRISSRCSRYFFPAAERLPMAAYSVASWRTGACAPRTRDFDYSANGSRNGDRRGRCSVHS